MAVAAPVRSLTDARPAPFVTDETREAMRQQLLMEARNPNLRIAPTDLGLTNTYVFRTLPGMYRQVMHTVDGPPQETDNEKRTAFNRKRWEQRVTGATKRTRDSGQPPAKVFATAAEAERYYDDLIDRLGSRTFAFNRIGKKLECFYATDDDVIAGYLKALIEAKIGEFAHVYCERGGARLVVGLGTDLEKAFPNTETGRKFAHQYAQDAGVTSIEIVTE